MSITDRIDSVTSIPPEFQKAVLPPPPAVKVELTAACDFKCFFCATSQDLRVKRHMDFDLFKRIAKDMRNEGVHELGLFYLGESFLYPRLVDAVRYAKGELGFPYVFLTTNGRMATEERVRGCIEAGLDSLKFSINYADAEQCKEITGVDAYETVIRHLIEARVIRDATAKRTGKRCGLYASSIWYSAEHEQRMKPLLDEIALVVDEHYWLPLYDSAGYTLAAEKARGLMPVVGSIGRFASMRDPLPCWTAFREGHVTADGKLSACCFDHEGKYTIGDLTQQGFMEAWNSETARKLREAHLRHDLTGTVCEGCIGHV